MKILNLYAGIGGNRKLWGDDHEITAVEYDEATAEVYKHYFPNDEVIIADAHKFLLDNFKKYNDTIGHFYGDSILKEVANIIKSHIREIDFPARYGGEEFAVVFPYADVRSVINVAEAIRKSIEQHVFTEETSDPSLASITVSIGVAFCPADANNTDDLIEKADYMLYRAKKSGKNQICAAR